MRVLIAQDAHGAQRVLRAVHRSRSLGSGVSHETGASPALPRSLAAACVRLSRLGTIDCSADVVAGRAPQRRQAITRLSTPRNPSPVVEDPPLAAVSRCSPCPGSRPPGRSPFPVTTQVLVPEQVGPQGLSGANFLLILHPQGCPQRWMTSPPDTRRCPPRHPPLCPQPPRPCPPFGHPWAGTRTARSREQGAVAAGQLPR